MAPNPWGAALRSFTVAAVLLLSGAAFAQRAEALGRQGSPLCSLCVAVVFIAIFRLGGVGWLSSIGTSVLPALFGWSIWKQRSFSFGIRLFALVLAIFQAAGFVLGLIAAIATPLLVRHYLAAAGGQGDPPPAQVAPAPLSPAAEEALGLHPWGTVVSQPVGARVFVDGELRGTAPLRARLHAARKNTLRLELDGFFPETRVVEPDTNEAVEVSVTLRPAVRLRVSSEPPGARVSVRGQTVLEETPGATAPLEPGPVELTVSRHGYQAVRRQLTLATGEETLAVALVPGARVAVSSSPLGAEVRADDVLLGVTPLDAYLSPKGKHTLLVSKPGLSSVKRVLSRVKGTERVEVTLVDAELRALQQRLGRARADYERADVALSRLQRKVEELAAPSPAAERELAAAEKAMETAATQLESAETAVRAAEDARARGDAPAPR